MALHAGAPVAGAGTTASLPYTARQAPLEPLRTMPTALGLFLNTLPPPQARPLCAVTRLLQHTMTSETVHAAMPPVCCACEVCHTTKLQYACLSHHEPLNQLAPYHRTCLYIDAASGAHNFVLVKLSLFSLCASAQHQAMPSEFVQLPAAFRQARPSNSLAASTMAAVMSSVR